MIPNNLTVNVGLSLKKSKGKKSAYTVPLSMVDIEVTIHNRTRVGVN